MNDHGPWKTEDFDGMSWHDVHIHGFRLDEFKENDGSADMVLDIDYILNWQSAGSGVLFTICQAVLRFNGVFGLKFSLDYATPTAGMCPFSIAGIQRELLVASSGFRSNRWKIPLSWPNGSLEFEAPAFTQTLVGEPTVQSQQSLSPGKRARLVFKEISAQP